MRYRLHPDPFPFGFPSFHRSRKVMMIKPSQFRLAAIALALTAWLPLQANAGLLDDDEARKAILDLRAKVDALARDINARVDNKADKSISLDLVNQHEQTMQEISRLRGQVEVLANEI